jgi:hypothetical protein
MQDRYRGRSLQGYGGLRSVSLSIIGLTLLIVIVTTLAGVQRTASVAGHSSADLTVSVASPTHASRGIDAATAVAPGGSTSSPISSPSPTVRDRGTDAPPTVASAVWSVAAPVPVTSVVAAVVSVAPVAPASSGCHPVSASGQCFAAGQLCPATDSGVTAVAADGQLIQCPNSGDSPTGSTALSSAATSKPAPAPVSSTTTRPGRPARVPASPSGRAAGVNPSDAE